MQIRRQHSPCDCEDQRIFGLWLVIGMDIGSSKSLCCEFMTHACMSQASSIGKGWPNPILEMFYEMIAFRLVPN